MKTAWVLLVAVALSFMLMSCQSLTPEQEAKFDELQQKMSAVKAESEKVAAQIERLKEKKDALLEKLKNGELSAVDAAELIATVSDEMTEAVSHFNRLQAEGKAIAADIKDLSESGLPWYSIAIKIALGALALYLGKEKLTLGTAVTGLVRAIEFGRDKKDTKKKAAALHNSAVERAVLKLPGIQREPLPSEVPPPEEEPPPKK